MNCWRGAVSSSAPRIVFEESSHIAEKLVRADNRIGRWLAGGRDDREILEELFTIALARLPTHTELEVCKRLLQDGDRRQAYEDILWAVINTREFVFVR